jgi:hypothetical protein
MDLLEDPNQMILHVMASVVAYIFLLANPYKHLGAEFCAKNKTWNIREIREDAEPARCERDLGSVCSRRFLNFGRVEVESLKRLEV